MRKDLKSPEYLAYKREWQRKHRAKLKAAGIVPPPLDEGERIEVPAWVLRERDRAFAAGWPSLSAYLLGDPLIGRSALERNH